MHNDNVASHIRNLIIAWNVLLLKHGVKGFNKTNAVIDVRYVICAERLGSFHTNLQFRLFFVEMNVEKDFRDFVWTSFKLIDVFRLLSIRSSQKENTVNQDAEPSASAGAISSASSPELTRSRVRIHIEVLAWLYEGPKSSCIRRLLRDCETSAEVKRQYCSTSISYSVLKTDRWKTSDLTEAM